MSSPRPFVTFLAVWIIAAASLASAAQPAKKEPAPPKPTTHTAKRAPFKIEITLKGVFEAKTMTEVVFRPGAWGELFVRKAAEAGTRVKKGAVVLELDTRKLDETIRGLEAGRRLAEIAVELKQHEIAAMKESLPLDREAAERAKKHADEDFERYEKIDRPLSVKHTRFAVKRAKDYLDYQKEELRQLEKMYKADDLTEETEEIVLRRQRDAVERVTFALESAQAKAERTLKVDLPRRDVAVREGVQRQAIALAKARATLEMGLEKALLELEQQRRAQKKAAEKLAKLKKDREAMIVKAPVDGILYYGPCVQGNWPKLAQSLAQGTKIAPHSVVLTIVQPQPLLVRGTVPEKELHRLRPGIEARAVPVGYPDLTLRGKLDAVSLIPVSAGNFGVRLSIDGGKAASRLVPGMNCSVTLVPYENKNALAVPASAVFTDARDAKKACVYVRKKDGSHEKRLVTVGRKTAKQAEILAGLKQGEVVFLSKPKGAQ